MLDTTFVFMVIAAILIIGFLGDLFFKKTGIPFFIFLIVMGIVLGPVLNVLPREPLLPALAIFAELTLLMVLFYGGLDTRFDAAVKGGGRAFIQVSIYVVGSTTLIGLLVNFFLGWDTLQSFIFASMVGGETTAAVVIPLSRSLNFEEVTVAFLTLESAMNTIFSIVFFFTFVGAYSTGVSDWITALATIGVDFGVGIALGTLLGIVWVFILHYLQRQKFTYVLTLGLVFVTYTLSTRLGGNGELSVLIFGILLGNYYLLHRLARRRMNMDPLRKQLQTFQEEISFLMETLFFVFLGLTFVINPDVIISNLATALVVVAVLLGVRYVATTVSTVRSEMRSERKGIILMCAQGLVPATLAIIALNLELPLANDFLSIVTYVIIVTNVVTAAGAILDRRRRKRASLDSESRNYSHFYVGT
jgi:cell volume regulation protein A